MRKKDVAVHGFFGDFPYPFGIKQLTETCRQRILAKNAKKRFSQVVAIKHFAKIAVKYP